MEERVRGRRWMFPMMSALATFIASPSAWSVDVMVGWDPPRSRADGSPLAGSLNYKVFCGSVPGAYEHAISVGSTTNARVSGLAEGTKYYFTCQAFSQDGLESEMSGEIGWTVPDISPPVIEGLADLALDADAEGLATVPDVRPSVKATDNCTAAASLVVEQTPAPGTRVARGRHVLSFHVRDLWGNIAQRLVNVSVDVPAGPRRPALTWEAVEGATWYHMWIARDGKPCFRKWLNQSNATWTPDFDLPAGTYTWWVRPWGEGIGYGDWRGAFAFAIDPMVPAQVVLDAPPASVAAGPLALTWGAVEHASWYYVWVNRHGALFEKRWLRGVTAYASATAIPRGEYQAWVRGWSMDGYGPWSAGVTCRYGVAAPESPRDVVLEERRPAFTWAGADGAEAYELWVERNGKPRIQRELDGTATMWTPDADLAGGAYRWWVRAKIGGAYGPWSRVACFEVASHPPAAVEALGEAAVDGTNHVSYLWRCDGKASWYQIWINEGDAKCFAQWIETGKVATDLTCTVAGHRPGFTYTWWVRGWNEDGLGPWSDPRTFIYK